MSNNLGIIFFQLRLNVKMWINLPSKIYLQQRKAVCGSVSVVQVFMARNLFNTCGLAVFSLSLVLFGKIVPN